MAQNRLTVGSSHVVYARKPEEQKEAQAEI
ncbi:UMTA protein [Colletotrichum limetticola]|uniref:UMTA protein n=1 Tax=Colletotrichum limetticola TaxID=1209924 RepID=A0ABQ9QED2_9PEZI|nr:UMTA protein [Colletotrichum limetticola]